MTGLEQAFYIIGIIYMSISLIIIVGLLVAIVVIRNKIVSLENIVKEKVEAFTSMGAKAGEIAKTVQKLTKHKSK